MVTVKQFSSKLSKIITEFDQYFKERQEVIRGALLAIFSNEHILLLGPPGTAKSLLARNMCSIIENANFFYYLLTRFTVPEEIFGPLSLKALEEDRFSRRIENYLPTAHIAFIDEIFKANSSILNSLLTIINERIYHNGSEIVKVPLLTIFGASNELPEEGENLEALYDRFLFRYSVSNIEEEQNFIEVVLNKNEFVPSFKISLEDIKKIQNEAKNVEISEKAQQILLELRRNLKKEDIYVSDRRWKKIIQVLKVGAITLGRDKIDETLMLICKDLLWDIPEQLNYIRQRLIKLVGSGGINIIELRERINNLYENIKEDMKSYFPKKIKCCQCNYSCQTIEKLKSHFDSTSHYCVRCPECGQTIYIDDVDDVKQHFVRKHNWNIKYRISERKKALYKKELDEIVLSYTSLQKTINEGRTTLEDNLKSNIWITEKERIEVLTEFDNIIKEMKELETIVANIEDLLNPKT